MKNKNINNRIIDIALKYGYDSPDSFTKAFTRFHGSTPKEVRKGGKIKDTFDYIIGDDYNQDLKVPKDFEVIEIPKFTWAIFSCIGPANEKMFKM